MAFPAIPDHHVIHMPLFNLDIWPNERFTLPNWMRGKEVGHASQSAQLFMWH